MSNQDARQVFIGKPVAREKPLRICLVSEVEMSDLSQSRLPVVKNI